MAEPVVLVPRTTVESSNIASVGYSEQDRTLAVEFQSGAIFQYRDVEPGLWERFCEATSKGSFFALHVKGRYRADKMTGPCPSCGAQGVIGTKCADCGCAEHAREERRYEEPAR